MPQPARATDLIRLSAAAHDCGYASWQGLTEKPFEHGRPNVKVDDIDTIEPLELQRELVIGAPQL